MRRIVALDPSLKATGVAVLSLPHGALVACPETTLLKPKSVGMPRLATIRNALMQVVEGSDLVVIEGYSFGSKGRAVFNIAELGGVLRLAMHEAGHTVVELPPSVVKKLATGKGNAGKEEVLAAAIRRLNYTGHDNNEADALWMLAAAQLHYGLPGAPELPKGHLAALDTVTWPALN